jgi:MOSC domain-containing protein
MTARPRVTSLVAYPVKSCAGIALSEAVVTVRGLELDRDLMVIDDAADFVSQRKVPELALVVPTISERAITLKAPGMEPIELPLVSEPDDDTIIEATVHGRPVAGRHVGKDLDEWFTTFLPRYRDNRRFRVVRVCEDAPRYIKERYHLAGASNQVGFADGNSMLLASERSLAQLNRELAEPIPMDRFRPNIVIDGPGLAPYAEDAWTQLQIGAMTAYVVKACDRCAIPDTDQRTAVVGKEVRRALRTRKGANAHDASNTGVFFAQNLNHVHTPGLTIRVGDEVHVLARSLRPNVVLDADPAAPASQVVARARHGA